MCLNNQQIKNLPPSPTQMNNNNYAFYLVRMLRSFRALNYQEGCEKTQ